MILPQSDPLLHDAVKARELLGFSGARVFLLTGDGRHWFIRKSAKDASQSSRLRSQVAKQMAFGQIVGDVLQTPPVINEGEIDGRYYFDMEFVRGVDGVTFLRGASYSDVKKLASRLVEYLKVAAFAAPLRESGRASLFDALFGKLCEVQQATGAIGCETLSRLFLQLDRLRKQTELRETLCHGDLTLHNLIIGDRGEIWVFDLLDAPYEHYWQDIAKLHQDLSGGWFRLAQAPVAQCVLDYVGKRVLDAAKLMHPAYAEVHSLLVASTFVRILPYATAAEQRQFIQERIDYFTRHGDSAPGAD
jgi:aminoglycoside phosphotransferase